MCTLAMTELSPTQAGQPKQPLVGCCCWCVCVCCVCVGVCSVGPNSVTKAGLSRPGPNSVNTIPPIQQNYMKNGYDENKGYGKEL